MKKLLFLASFVFENTEGEFRDHQLVLVTDRDVEAVLQRQQDINPENVRSYDHRDAAYHLAETWFKETYTDSKLTHLIVNKPIQSAEPNSDPKPQ
jgi:hypothetical protein